MEVHFQNKKLSQLVTKLSQLVELTDEYKRKYAENLVVERKLMYQNHEALQLVYAEREMLIDMQERSESKLSQLESELKESRSAIEEGVLETVLSTVC